MSPIRPRHSVSPTKPSRPRAASTCCSTTPASAAFGIRVNALLPGTIHTPFVEKYLRESYPSREEGLKAIRKRQLTSELGQPEDVASAALFLASDESSFVMGSGLFVDGGVRGGK